jgi:hypothetical protein
MRALRTAAAVGAALLIASCSSEQAPSAPTTTDSGSPPAHGSLADCLKANGVTETGGAPVVLGPPAGVDQATWDTAMKACATLAPGPAGP